MRLPAMMLTEMADGEIRIYLGRVGAGTAKDLARIVNDHKRGRRRACEPRWTAFSLVASWRCVKGQPFSSSCSSL